MGLAEDLAALKELHVKRELSDAAYDGARDAAIAKNSATRPTVRRSIRWSVVVVVVVLGFVAWNVARSRESTRALATAVGAPITLVDDIQNLPAASWKAVPLTLPYAGSLDVDLAVARGNPVDVFLIGSDQFGSVKKEDWNHLLTWSEFNAVKTKTYRRSGHLTQGVYYLVMRDPSLGILSSSASDVSLKVRLNP